MEVQRHMLPKDSYMLLSVVNTKLRDEYPSLSELCASMAEDEDKIINQLALIGYEYNESLNRFM